MTGLLANSVLCEVVELESDFMDNFENHEEPLNGTELQIEVKKESFSISSRNPFGS